MSNEYLKPVQHKFAVGDDVVVTSPFSRLHLYPGSIIGLLPYRLVAPAYDVLISGQRIAMSERSLEKIESQEGETA